MHRVELAPGGGMATAATSAMALCAAEHARSKSADATCRLAKSASALEKMHSAAKVHVKICSSRFVELPSYAARHAHDVSIRACVKPTEAMTRLE